jgi:two-component system, NtrC family, nitrogen regulation sensor histidine kinase NtrY
MRLAVKLTLTIAVASIVPTGAATLVGRELVQRGSRAEFDEKLRSAVDRVASRYLEVQEEVTKIVERLADPDDQFTGPILIAVANGGPDDDTFRQLYTAAPRVMRERGLDMLQVLGPRGVILASGHFPGRMGDQDPRFPKLQAARDAQLEPEDLLEEGKPASSRLTVQVQHLVRSSLGSRVLIVGGRLLERAFAGKLRLPAGTLMRIEDARGRELGATGDKTGAAEASAAFTAYPHRPYPLRDARGRTVARVVVAVPDDSLRASLRAINYAAATLAASGLVLALLLGAIAGRRLSRRLADLAGGAASVAAGDLDRQLVERGRDEVSALMRAFNRMTSQLKESKQKLVAAERIAAWQEIARRIAHEIKNPLFPIQTSIETLRKVYAKKHPDFDEIFNESTSTILEEVTRLKNIVTEFSQFARLPKPKLAPCDLAEVVPQVFSLYGDGAVKLEAALPPGLPPVLADREQLTQVLVNLIKNAREALSGRPDPRVRVEAAAVTGEGLMRIAVSDNGPGFGDDVAGQIFTPYFTTKGQAGGTGLGLAIVQRIVDEHGGRGEALGAPGEGATFIVHLPLAPSS